ncbi:hypothetical protein HOE425_320225 [Hoeflea sp. EC-HK425]|nr:hypothetical protein HOE425_320225 [Hoeflea sp. EC-HK425]
MFFQAGSRVRAAADPRAGLSQFVSGALVESNRAPK